MTEQELLWDDMRLQSAMEHNYWRQMRPGDWRGGGNKKRTRPEMLHHNRGALAHWWYDFQEDDRDEFSREFVDTIIDRILVFMTAIVGHSLHPYQEPFARRIIESVIINEFVEQINHFAIRFHHSEDIGSVIIPILIQLSMIWGELVNPAIEINQHVIHIEVNYFFRCLSHYRANIQNIF